MTSIPSPPGVRGNQLTARKKLRVHTLEALLAQQVDQITECERRRDTNALAEARRTLARYQAVLRLARDNLRLHYRAERLLRHTPPGR